MWQQNQFKPRAQHWIRVSETHNYTPYIYDASTEEVQVDDWRTRCVLWEAEYRSKEQRKPDEIARPLMWCMPAWTNAYFRTVRRNPI